jgi:RNA polymerase sigma factor (sigma-70 family)
MSQGYSYLASPWSSTSGASPAPRSVDEEVSELYVDYADALTRHLLIEFGRDDAEEVTQEAFLRLYVSRRSGVVIDAPRGWLTTVARNLMINRAKADGRYALPLQPDYEAAVLDPTPEEVWVERERVVSAEAAMRELSDIERRCLVWRVQGLKLQEIARRLAVLAPELGELDHRRISEILALATSHIRQRMQQR